MENKLQNTALVLGNEDLLIPILNSLPSCIENINITMGLPLKQIPFSAFIRPMVPASQRVVSICIYYQDVIAVLSHQFVRPLFQTPRSRCSLNLIITTIKDQNLISLTKDQIIAIAPEHKNNLELLFDVGTTNPSRRLESVLSTDF